MDKKNYPNFTVAKYISFGEDYAYNDDFSLNFQDSRYEHILSQEYEDNRLVSVNIYKADGIITYNKSELDLDTALYDYFKLSKIREIKRDKGNMIDNMITTSITHEAEGYIYCKKEDTLYIYKIDLRDKK